MKVLNLREWLAERGVLLEYVRNRVADKEWATGKSPNADVPESWIYGAFWIGRTGPGGALKWGGLSEEWAKACRGDRPVVPGMPLDDKLGMTLLLAKLEAGDEKA